jgi:hypothetical protein
MTSRRTIAVPTFILALAVDAILVLVFVLIGRASHDENPVLGALTTYWPFLVALGAGWIASLGWRAPLSIVRTGLPVWAITVALGMVLRVVADQGVQLSFVIVTSIVLAVFLLGWRAIAALVLRRRTRRG